MIKFHKPIFVFMTVMNKSLYLFNIIKYLQILLIFSFFNNNKITISVIPLRFNHVIIHTILVIDINIGQNFKEFNTA